MTDTIRDEARAIGQEVYEEMFQRLMNYKMDTMRCEDDAQRGYPLIDFLSSSRSVDTGKREIEMIVDDVANSGIDAIIQRALTAARNKAMEDAAKHIDVAYERPGNEFADAIRAMKVQP